MTNTVVVDQRFENDPAKVVWKYAIKLDSGPQTVQVPVGARLVHVEYISGPRVFQLWYEVDLKHKDTLINHVFQIWGTGDDTIPKAAKHVSTGINWYEVRELSQFGGSEPHMVPQFVWHLYEYPTGAKVVDV